MNIISVNGAAMPAMPPMSLSRDMAEQLTGAASVLDSADNVGKAISGVTALLRGNLFSAATKVGAAMVGFASNLDSDTLDRLFGDDEAQQLSEAMSDDDDLDASLSQGLSMSIAPR